MRKFNELVLFMVARAGGRGLVATKLMKLLYFSDASFFKKHRKTISGVDYFKNHFGPTPDVKVFERTLKELGEFMVKENVSARGKKISVFRIRNKNYAYRHLTAEEMEVANQVYERYGRLTAADLSNLSHLDPPFLVAKLKERVNFKFVLRRKESDDDIEESLSDSDQRRIAEDINDENLAKFLTHVSVNS